MDIQTVFENWLTDGNVEDMRTYNEAIGKGCFCAEIAVNHKAVNDDSRVQRAQVVKLFGNVLTYRTEDGTESTIHRYDDRNKFMSLSL
jgi:phage major head subunit gpT-like protein